MSNSLSATVLAAALTLGITGAVAQTSGDVTTPGQGGANAAQPGMMQPGMMPGRGMMGGPGRGMGVGRHGAMAPMMMRVMFVAIDADGSGTLSLEEVQAFHARMFAAADANGDGELAPAEMRDVMTGAFPE